MAVRAIIRLCPTSPEGVLIPVQYNQLVQGLIYSSWNVAMAEFIHDRGFPFEARTFRMFVFSRLSGSYEREDQQLRFRGPITLQLASPIHALIEETASRWLRAGEVRLGSAILAVEATELRATPKVGPSALVRTLSPVTVYETLHAADGTTRTYYYAPTEQRFGQLCATNAQRKLLAMAQAIATFLRRPACL